MKNYVVPEKHLTPTLSDAIKNNESGIYIIYGVFIDNGSLSINKLYKGGFDSITVHTVDESKVFMVPTPEFVVGDNDAFARYVQLHLLREVDIQGKTDEELMQDFVKSFAAKMLGDAANTSAAAAAATDDTAESDTQKAEEKPVDE